MDGVIDKKNLTVKVLAIRGSTLGSQLHLQHRGIRSAAVTTERARRSFRALNRLPHSWRR